ncbi:MULTISPECIES: glutathione S-transferase family protein [Kordiimonas]|jgi:glutathione S-transferase|uniref:glutathione S-transferase family protein n=1 Tax=Kordiimonas TaxID=288021 RepID=UPI00257CFCF1|nr:glutathione S-transferase family protein [Kordiimonas sp. UBA4487]
MYRLFYYPKNASLAPHFVLTHLGVPFSLELVDRKADAQKSADYLKLNPAGRIPTLVDGKTVLFESPAICLYLAERHMDACLAPAPGSPHRAKFLQWLMYLTNTLQADYMVYCYPEKHTQDPLGAMAVEAAHSDRVAAAFKILDEALEGQPYLVGNTVTICDYFLLMLCIWADDMPVPPQSFPRLGAYLKRLSAHKVVRQVCNTEGISLAALA